MSERHAKVTPADAVARAAWTVNGPVMLAMFGAPAAAFGLAVLLHANPGLMFIVVMAAAVGGWFGAWTLWSYLTPRWRLWAYTHVDDLEELKRLAVEASVIWPKGHIFERTEIAGKALRAELERLEASKSHPG